MKFQFPKVFREDKDGQRQEVPRKYTVPTFVALIALIWRGAVAFVDDLAGKKQ